jgi:5-(aminomethyl)-3-furanmethanol phosphate kinase
MPDAAVHRAWENWPPLVVKIGGSLLAGGGVRDVLQHVSKSERRVVIVPGGGPFADAVRAAQAEQGFSDSDAHRLAILAMHQMAGIFQDMQPGLVPVETIADMHEAWDSRATPIWLPWALIQNAPTIPQDWSFTSDSLAAWLAARLPGAELVLVKSCGVAAEAALTDLAAAGTVDPQFPIQVSKSAVTWHVIGTGGSGRLAALLRATPSSIP